MNTPSPELRTLIAAEHLRLSNAMDERDNSDALTRLDPAITQAQKEGLPALQATLNELNTAFEAWVEAMNYVEAIEGADHDEVDDLDEAQEQEEDARDTLGEALRATHQAIQ